MVSLSRPGSGNRLEFIRFVVWESSSAHPWGEIEAAAQGLASRGRTAWHPYSPTRSRWASVSTPSSQGRRLHSRPKAPEGSLVPFHGHAEAVLAVAFRAALRAGHMANCVCQRPAGGHHLLLGYPEVGEGGLKLAGRPRISDGPGIPGGPGIAGGFAVAAVPGRAGSSLVRQDEVALFVLGSRAGEVQGSVEVLGDVEPAVRAIGVGYADRVVCVHQAGSLLKDRVGSAYSAPGPGDVGRGHHAALDVVGDEARVGLQHKRRHTGGHRRRLRSAGHHEVLRAVIELGMKYGDYVGAFHDPAQVTAGGDDIRLREALEGRSGSRERSELVVAGCARRIAVGHGPDGDDVRDVAGNAYGHGPGATVAGGDDHDDARLPGLHERLVERILPVPGVDRGAEGAVQDADVVKARTMTRLAPGATPL